VQQGTWFDQHTVGGGSEIRLHLPGHLLGAKICLGYYLRAMTVDRHTILLDEPFGGIRHLLANFLRQNGYTIVEAQDDPEALRIIDEL
jgi:hypothetical protein